MNKFRDKMAEGAGREGQKECVKKMTKNVTDKVIFRKYDVILTLLFFQSVDAFFLFYFVLRCCLFCSFLSLVKRLHNTKFRKIMLMN